MPLPKIQHPIFDVVVPSTGKKIKIRPMLVREEKILLMAKASTDDNDVLPAIKQVVNNCIVDNDVDIDKFALFDLEYMFVKIRSVSVSNIAKVSYKDNADGKVYDFEVDLEKVEVKFPEKVEKSIQISEQTGVMMKYPEASLYSDTEFLDSSADNFIDNLIVRCIDKIYDGDQTYDSKTVTKQEIAEFVENLDVNTYEKMRQFFTDLPKLYYSIDYKNSLGEDRKIEMTSLTDFFTLR